MKKHEDTPFIVELPLEIQKLIVESQRAATSNLFMNRLEDSTVMSNLDTYRYMLDTTPKRSLINIKGVHSNRIHVICPSKYTIPKPSRHLECSNELIKGYAVSINLMVLDGYTGLANTDDCTELMLEIYPGFSNDKTLIFYENPLLNKQASHILEKFHENW